MTNPTVRRISRRANGVAGQFAYNVLVSYDDAVPTIVTFTSSIYGAPVVMLTPSCPEGIFVTDADRFGPELNREWIGKFFAN